MAAKKSKAKIPMKIEEFRQSELPVIVDLIDFTNNMYVSVYANNTAVKTPESIFRGLLFSRNHLVAEDYLLNFKKSLADISLGIGVTNYRTPNVLAALAARKLKERPEQLIPLPEYKNIRMPLGAVVRSRRSGRTYSGQALELKDLSTILFYCQGVSGGYLVENLPQSQVLGEAGKYMQLRNVPSGGALYPIDLYFLAIKVKGLRFGLYKYVPEHHGLKEIKLLKDGFELKALGQFEKIDLDKAAIYVVYVYKLMENSRKYGEMGLAFAFIEAGSISQNLHLACTALGCGSCDIGGFAKTTIEKLIELDGLSQHVIHATLVGC